MKDMDPVLAFALKPVCAHIGEAFAGDIHEGDVFLHNDVFTGGNQNNDVAVFRPVFFGGWAGSRNRIRLFGPDGEVRDALSKEIIRDIRKGTRFTQFAGGGLGDPKARDAEKVAGEVRDGLLSTAAAGEDYGVAIDPGTGSVDVPATRHLRGEGK